MKKIIERVKYLAFKNKCRKQGLRIVPLRVDGEVKYLFGIA